MHGVVSLLDDPHYEQVERLWAELALTFEVRGVYVTPYPHFSYHVAAHYDLDRLDPTLQTVAGLTAPFRVRTTGLGVFTGAQPVLYLPVVRTAHLSRVHSTLWQAIAPTTDTGNPYYHPDQWMPHITLGLADVSPDRLGTIMAQFAARSFNWEIAVDQFALIYDDGVGQTVRARYPFGQAAAREAES